MQNKLVGGNHWVRVNGADLHAEDKKSRTDRIVSVLVSTNFKRACENVGIEPTKRQASKWANGKGKAFKTWNHMV